ncbi:MAG: FeoB-associated Cys-rich membrane protein [Clostridiales bacterium]|nr:FeoB-associated Cys-rich membrane protein [Clostridiales bacterium]
MLAFFTENLATILIGLILLLIVAAIVIHLVRKKKRGQSSCGCGCSSCPLSSSCHTTPPTH